ncbi:MAG: glycosyltransferase [Eubacteriales bacterium]|nr:glycosyltransferase [Eubacteriales bacterium]MDD3881147.1 glycosyltransferase [Eubacteriales bacterium]MDD4511529.1 glycosyltransferase [Eubacteriales bacterium]
MKKLLFVINTMGRAGAETALIELLRRLEITGRYEISLYAILPYGELFARVPKGVKILNRRFSCRSVLSFSGRAAIAGNVVKSFFYRFTGFKMLGDMRKNMKLQKKSGRMQYDKLLWRLLAKGRKPLGGEYDLAVAYLEGAATYFVADMVQAKAKASFIHIDYKRAGYLPEMDAGCYERIDRIFTVSNEVANQFLSVYPQYRDKVFLFRNLLNREGILEKAEKVEGFTDGFEGKRLVTVGRLHYQKAYDIAIQALRIIKDNGVNARWYILGDGPERAALEKQIDDSGLRGSFVLMGAVDNPYQYVKAADVYVHATRFEGKSIAIEEAQILGKAIVASNCTGNTEQIVDGVDGILLELSPENLAREIMRVLGDDGLRKTLEENTLKKNLDHPEDMKRLLELMNEEG